MNNFYAQKNILITGGTGSIGSALVHRLLQEGANVRIVSRDEYKQYMMQMALADFPQAEYYLGDVRDEARMTEVAAGIDIIFHCAAYKHVPLCENNAEEAHKTNVIGTRHVIQAAQHNQVQTMLLISSDKAANPRNAMGTSKLQAEQLVCNADADSSTKCAAVRFGNVLGSRGSVIPTLLWQMQHGRPITVTDPSMTRFFLPIDDVVRQVLAIAVRLEHGALYALKMPAAKLGDLIDACVDELAPMCDMDPSQVAVQTIGIREGEKMHEQLLTDDELILAQEHDQLFIVPAAPTEPASPTSSATAVHSDTAAHLTKEELRTLVRTSLQLLSDYDQQNMYICSKRARS